MTVHKLAFNFCFFPTTTFIQIFTVFVYILSFMSITIKRSSPKNLFSGKPYK